MEDSQELHQNHEGDLDRKEESKGKNKKEDKGMHKGQEEKESNRFESPLSDRDNEKKYENGIFEEENIEKQEIVKQKTDHDIVVEKQEKIGKKLTKNDKEFGKKNSEKVESTEKKDLVLDDENDKNLEGLGRLFEKMPTMKEEPKAFSNKTDAPGFDQVGMFNKLLESEDPISLKDSLTKKNDFFQDSSSSSEKIKKSPQRKKKNSDQGSEKSSKRKSSSENSSKKNKSKLVNHLLSQKQDKYLDKNRESPETPNLGSPVKESKKPIRSEGSAYWSKDLSETEQLKKKVSEYEKIIQKQSDEITQLKRQIDSQSQEFPSKQRKSPKSSGFLQKKIESTSFLKREPELFKKEDIDFWKLADDTTLTKEPQRLEDIASLKDLWILNMESGASLYNNLSNKKVQGVKPNPLNKFDYQKGIKTRALPKIPTRNSLLKK